ncbi:hypothetical protein MY1884_003663 [Beauveria asiatica]
MMNGVQGPAAVLAEKMQEIAAHIENFFERYGSSALAESDKQAIKDDIVRHAGKKRMLEENGLQDAEKAHETRLVAVLTTFLEEVNTLVGPVADGYISHDSPHFATASREHMRSPTLYSMAGPDPAPNGLCPSQGDTGLDASSERLRRGSSESRDRRREAKNAETSFVASPHHRDEGDDPPQVPAGYSHGESQSDAPVAWGEWRIDQIKTAQFTSPGLFRQCWSWEAEDQCLVYRVASGQGSKWVAPIPVRFDVKWRDVINVQETVQRFANFCLGNGRTVTEIDPQPKSQRHYYLTSPVPHRQEAGVHTTVIYALFPNFRR